MKNFSLKNLASLKSGTHFNVNEIMNDIKSMMNEAIEEIRFQVCETYGSPAEEENADEVNEELSNFVKDTADEAFEPVIDFIAELIAERPATHSNGSDPIVARRLEDLEAKLDRLLSREPNISPNLTTPIGQRKKGRNPWVRYQKAWYNWCKATGIDVPLHAGDRSKLCASEPYYKTFKKKSAEVKEEFLAENGA